MTVSHTHVSDNQLNQAKSIRTVDRNNSKVPGYQLWGDKPTPGAFGPLDLEIEVASDDHFAILQLIGRIEKVKGSLPPEVELLRVELAS